MDKRQSNYSEKKNVSSRFYRFRNKKSTFDKLCLILLWIVVVITVIAVYWIDPVGFRYSPQCFFYRFAGFYCPGCGTARSLHALVHFDFLQAIDYNLFTVISLPFILYALITETIRKFTRIKIPAVNIDARLIQLLLILIVIFWILRNIRIPPFSALAP